MRGLGRSWEAVGFDGVRRTSNGAGRASEAVGGPLRDLVGSRWAGRGEGERKTKRKMEVPLNIQYPISIVFEFKKS